MSSSSSSPFSSVEVTPWMYFVAGTLVPTIGYWLMPKGSSSTSINRGYDDDGDDDDSSDDDDGTGGVVTKTSNTANSSSSSPSCKNWGPQDAPYKMILCVNQELAMGKGKIAAQCSHAALGAYKKAQRSCPQAVKWWERTGCAKIAVKCPTEQEMYEILQKAHAKDIPLYLVEDAGRTQIAAGSRTVLGLGPAPASVFESVTSHLKLL